MTKKEALGANIFSSKQFPWKPNEILTVPCYLSFLTEGCGIVEASDEDRDGRHIK